jgi:hypothetical protein
VNCEVCGSELPHGALFCGECGRAVGLRSAKTLHPDSGMPVDGPGSGTSEQVVEAGAVLTDEADVAVIQTDPRDTAIIQPVVRDKLPELETELPATPATDDEIEQDLPPEVIAAEIAAAKVAGTVATEAEEVAEPAKPEPEGKLSRPDPFPWGDRGPAIFSDSDELEQTLIVPRRDTGERFVLQFSTGESVTVFGSGLLGRNPTPQPTEYFDQLVSISDPGKSVSKTHLEFGQEAGSFWVSDRFSGNGSAVREPESSPRRLVAGKRYRIVRGTRVDIGEQFFVVS